jgi:protein ImuB
MFGALYAAEGSPPDVLAVVAREFSPRIEVCDAHASTIARPSTSLGTTLSTSKGRGGPSTTEGREIVLDLSGLERLFGDARTIAEELRRTAADRNLRVRVAIAGTRTAARLLVHHRAGITIVACGDEATALEPLPITLLTVVAANESNDPNGSNEIVRTLRRWGLRTLGEFQALSPDEVAARLGEDGVTLQRLASGEDPDPLVPTLPEERFEQMLDLEWPIEGLEPLSFVLGRLMEPLSEHLARRDRGAAVLHVQLHLVTRTVHERSLQLPTPIRDARTLRTLALLDLESHPPSAAIDRVMVAVDPTPGRVIQYSLLTRPLPSPEQVSTLLARLSALMGEDRCGSPVVVDSWQPGVFGMRPFGPREAIRDPGSGIRDPVPGIAGPECGRSWIPDPGFRIPAVALRRFRVPVAARVRVEDGKPVRIATDWRSLSGGRVHTCAGPWRTSGAWWIERGTGPWDRDEWDVTLNDDATYRIFRERDTNHWFIEGIVD